MSKHRVTEDGLRLRVAPYLSSEIIAQYPAGTVVSDLQDDGHAWREVAIGPGEAGWMADTYLEPAEDVPSDDIEADTTPDRLFSLTELWPILTRACESYATLTPEAATVLAGLTYQESAFRNWRVHRDGTGHGLIGLDDNGLAPDFEAWAGRNATPFAIGQGANAAIIPVGLQLEYLAYQMARYTEVYGDIYAAARAWHRGPGLMDDALGVNYERLIRAHIASLFG